MPANIVVPEVGESIVDARVAKWLRQEGEVVAVGDPLVELETDKIDLEVSAPQGGVLKRIDRKDGEDVKVGEVLGVIEDAAGAARSGAAQTPPRQPRSRPKTASRRENAIDTDRAQGGGGARRRSESRARQRRCGPRHAP